jgi:nitrogenase molybdenum-cofactor synthesis protein NifE
MIAEIDKALFNPMWREVRTPAPWDEVDPLLVEQDAAQLASEAQPA